MRRVHYRREDSVWHELDRFEPGYERLTVRVFARDEAGLVAQAYVSEQLVAELLPFTWYKELMVGGARLHGLPSGYVRFLERIEARPDPRRGDPARREEE